METDPALSSELILAAVELMGQGGRDGTVRVQGESMRPTLRPGQLLAVDFAPRDLARGDLLVFRQGGLLLVHRLLGPARTREGRKRLRTRGDGVLTLDPPLDLECIVGRVVAIEDHGRWRSVRKPAARVYARLVALHDFFWGGMGSVFRRVDYGLERIGLGFRFRRWLVRVDRFKLRWVHRALFDWLHPAVAGPLARSEDGGRTSA
jgi:hypothetical protein